MRLIDADAITYELWTTEVDSNRDNYRYFQNRYMVDRRDIESMPTVEQWIPCSERLPEINKVVLITNEQGNVSYGQFRGTYGDYWHWRKNTLAKVTAWMPLPEPYTETKEETND